LRTLCVYGIIHPWGCPGFDRIFRLKRASRRYTLRTNV